MNYKFSVWFNINGSELDRKTLIRWLTANVGVRGKDWSISKPKGANSTVLVQHKEHAALIRLTHSENAFPQDL
jgi:hypothetical protein